MMYPSEVARASSPCSMGKMPMPLHSQSKTKEDTCETVAE